MYKEIVVPLDGSELAERALPHACDLARSCGARLTLLTVVESFYPYPHTVDPYGGMWLTDEERKVEEQQWKAEVDRIREHLHQMTETMQAEGIDAREMVTEGDPASAICDYAKQINADLIIMSTHGRSGLKRWVYGSVADKVLRGADVPVLLVRAYGRE